MGNGATAIFTLLVVKLMHAFSDRKPYIVNVVSGEKVALNCRYCWTIDYDDNGMGVLMATDTDYHEFVVEKLVFQVYSSGDGRFFLAKMDDQGEINDMHWLDDWHFDRKVGTWHDACMSH